MLQRYNLTVCTKEYRRIMIFEHSSISNIHLTLNYLFITSLVSCLFYSYISWDVYQDISILVSKNHFCIEYLPCLVMYWKCSINYNWSLYLYLHTQTRLVKYVLYAHLYCWLVSQFCFWQGIGNGIPLGAVVTTPEIAKVLTQRSYFNTFGGNPVCTAAGLAVLRVIEKEKLQENAFVVGSHLKERLNALKDKYECKIFHPLFLAHATLMHKHSWIHSF